MAEFRVRDRSTGSVAAGRDEVWRALTDADLLPRLTPHLRRIDVHEDRWTWHLTHIPVLGAVVAPCFTEVMTFDEPSRIGFRHDSTRTDEKAAVEGEYRLSERPDGTDVAIDLTITVDLPFPRVTGPAVRTAMQGVVALMGRRFAANLDRHFRR